MAVPSYENLSTRWKIDSSIMKQEFSGSHIMDLASKIDKWELLAKSLEIPNPEIERIKNEPGLELQRIKLLESWKQRCGSKATYKAMVEALLRIDRTDLAEKIFAGLRRDCAVLYTDEPTNKHVSLLAPHSPSNSRCTVENVATLSTSSPSSTMGQDEQVISILKELEKEFYDLCVHTEVALISNEVHLEMLTRRFRMLPQSIRRLHLTDGDYSATRRRILNSTTIKELFDNLTELKHWNYMTPETLAYILQDVKIDDIHQEIDKYLSKLSTFKANTKLRDLIGVRFPVPDYCIELTMITKGWEDKSILDVEKSTMNILRRATYDSHNLRIGLKEVNPGSIKLVFILMNSISLEIHSTESEKLHEACKDSGITNLQIDGTVLYDHQSSTTKVKTHKRC